MFEFKFQKCNIPYHYIQFLLLKYLIYDICSVRINVDSGGRMSAK